MSLFVSQSSFNPVKCQTFAQIERKKGRGQSNSFQLT